MNDFRDAFNKGKEQRAAQEEQARVLMEASNQRVADENKVAAAFFDIVKKVVQDANKALSEERVGFVEKKMLGGVHFTYTRTGSIPQLPTDAYIEFYVQSGEVLARSWPEKGDPAHIGSVAVVDEAKVISIFSDAITRFAAARLQGKMPAARKR